MDTLKDIKPLVEIPDNSLIYIIIIGVILLFCIASIIFFIVKKRVPQRTPQDIAQDMLTRLDFNDSKDVAYHFTKYGKHLITEDNKQQFNAITQQLQQYKYKKQVAELNKQLIIDIKRFIND